MTTTAKLLRNPGDVDVTFGSQAGAIRPGLTFLEHRDGFDFTDGQRVVNKSVRIFI